MQRERIGVENILLEQDYPHCDSTWPRTQEIVHREIGDLPANDIAKITWQNASTLYDFPVPASVVADPESY